MFREEIIIPKRRIGAVIGTEGKTKEKIEQSLDCRLDINEDGTVKITSNDSLNVFIGKQIVKAIGRGFSARVAMKLKEEEFMFELIDLDEWAKNKNDMHRIKSRVIGREGFTKKKLIDSTNCDIVISGSTIGIIGRTEDTAIARQAIVKLLKGAKHATVYRFLDEKIRERKRRELLR